MIIDIHSHLYNIKNFEKDLIDIVKKLNYEKIVISGIEGNYWEYILGNEDVIRFYKKYPSLVIPFAHFRLGIDRKEKIDEFLKSGFKGIKFISPLKNYDDENYFEIYEKIEKENLISLFHTGIVSRRTAETKKENVSSSRMRPIFLETISRNFPNLIIIGAHLGYPWYEEAVEVARVNPNIYFDLSGPSIYSRDYKFFKEIFWIKNKRLGENSIIKKEKILFGSDIYYEKIPDYTNHLKSFFKKIDCKEYIEKFFYDIAYKIFKKKGIL
ncbi:MAG: amidohydrolase family protein [Candidatus Omnitrophica bacterium]|nr:amidohydrolase family protein [Candidatus Omnitrophota bacterium]